MAGWLVNGIFLPPDGDGIADRRAGIQIRKAVTSSCGQLRPFLPPLAPVSRLLLSPVSPRL